MRVRQWRALPAVRLVALLGAAVLLPSACVLWLMNQALASERAAADATLMNAYRGQLRLARARIDEQWRRRAADLDRAAGAATAAEGFRQLVVDGVADSAVVLGPGGEPQYPRVAPRPPSTPGELQASSRAEAAQEAVRALLRAGRRDAARREIETTLLTGTAARGVDRDGRLIAADAHLLLVSLRPPGEARRAAAARLAALLNDYSNQALPAPQRLFLMNELCDLLAADGAPPLPTRTAERLAIELLETGSIERRGQGLQPSRVNGVWQMASAGGGVVGLFTTDTITASTRRLLDGQGDGRVTFTLTPPGGPVADDMVAIGTAMPGWTLSFSPPARMDPAASPRRSTYVSMALLAIGAITLAAATLGGAVRRQARLAALRSDLVSAVSHELKTPLASMRLLVEALLEEESPAPARTREYLELMSAENARLTRLIENFLTFSRLERNRQRFTIVATSPDEIVRDTLAALPESRRASHPPIVELPSGLPAALADRDAMVTVLLNLLDNAYKYSSQTPHVALRVFAEARHVVFAVEDRGIGIPAREQTRIFRRFYRVDQRLARETSGSGLGLTIVSGIVRAHGGAVSVTSREGEGSTFFVRVPRAPGLPT